MHVSYMFFSIAVMENHGQGNLIEERVCSGLRFQRHESSMAAEWRYGDSHQAWQWEQKAHMEQKEGEVIYSLSLYPVMHLYHQG